MENKITIFDTTLRDGEQSPGCGMNLSEKLNMAHQLESLGVDVIEAGFAIASDDDFAAISAISRECRQPIIASLARCTGQDIERAAKAVESAARPRIHTFIATSDIHLKHKLCRTRDQVLQDSYNSVRLARMFVDDVEYSAEDATRSDMDYLCQIIETVIEAGASTINLPDTVGYTTPWEYSELITEVRARVKNIDQAVISVHCHNDLGLAVANSIAAVRSGARQVECTINGIGERAGNASLEEFVMILKVRPGSVAIRGRDQHRTDLSQQPIAIGNHRRASTAEQGDCRAQCFCARGGHSSGRNVEKSVDVRDYDPAVRWDRTEQTGSGQALADTRLGNGSRSLVIN